MFILKRQDVEIGNFKHPSKEQKIPILSYQGQTFRLLSVFNAAQEEDARSERGRTNLQKCQFSLCETKFSKETE